MNEYEVLGGLHQIVDAKVNLKMKNWIDSHNVNYSLLYPLAAIELGAIKEPPENMENLFKRCVAAFVYAKAIENKKDIFIKKFNTPGFKKYLKSYETELIPCYQNFRFSREINDINPFSKARIIQVGENRYKLTTSLVTDHYREEDVYFYGEDDAEIAKKEREQTFSLHVKFWNRVVLEKNTYEVLSNNIDEELYNCCIAIVEKDINKWNSRVRSTVFDNPNQLARVIAFFYYHAMLKSIFLRIDIDCTEDFFEVGKETIMYFNTKKSIEDIVRVTGLPEKKVTNIVKYLINDGRLSLLEFPLFEVEDTLVTVPSLILVNDWQFTIINGHYIKDIKITNREKTISTVTEGRIEKTLKSLTNIAVAKTVPYSFCDELGNILSSDIDYAIYDFTHNKVLVVEAKWIDKHYKDEIDKIYGKILETFNTIFSKQIEKHKKFLCVQQNIDFLFKDDERYKTGLPTPEIYYLAVDKRNQLHIGEKHMVSEYMLIYLLRKFTIKNELDLPAMWNEIEGLQTKVEYITVSENYHEIRVGEDIVLVEKDDLYWE